MAYEIVFVCNSINNKNVRNNELKILRKFEKDLYFEFGESESNIKKRFYRNIETLNEDFAKVEEIKKKLDNEESEKIKEVNKTSKDQDNIEKGIEENSSIKNNKYKKYYNRDIY